MAKMTGKLGGWGPRPRTVRVDDVTPESLRCEVCDAEAWPGFVEVRRPGAVVRAAPEGMVTIGSTRVRATQIVEHGPERWHILCSAACLCIAADRWAVEEHEEAELLSRLNRRPG